MNLGNIPLYLMFFMPFVAILEIVFIVIKLAGWTSFGWWVGMSPLIAYVAVAVFVFGWIYLKSSGYWGR